MEQGKTHMIKNEFVQSEILADDYIQSIIDAKKLLKSGKADECLNTLEELEHIMQITLAMSERYDVEVIN